MEHLRLSHKLEIEDYAEREGVTVQAVAKVQGVKQA